MCDALKCVTGNGVILLYRLRPEFGGGDEVFGMWPSLDSIVRMPSLNAIYVWQVLGRSWWRGVVSLRRGV